MLLKWPDVQLTGIITVSDDKGKRAGYTRYALQLVGREDISVKAGADISEGNYRPTPGIPNENE
jgi:purine nucleosidase